MDIEKTQLQAACSLSRPPTYSQKREDRAEPEFITIEEHNMIADQKEKGNAIAKTKMRRLKSYNVTVLYPRRWAKASYSQQDIIQKVLARETVMSKSATEDRDVILGLIKHIIENEGNPEAAVIFKVVDDILIRDR